MPDRVAALYYPDFFTDQRTLIKEILLFDELHFMDRPSFAFHKGGQFGTIGADSPIRRFEQAFRDDGVPVYVHRPYSGPVESEWYDKIKADLNDPAFLKEFVNGLEVSETFRNMVIAKGNYHPYGDESSVLRSMASVDLDWLEKQGGAIAVFEDTAIRHMDLGTEPGRAKNLVATAAICSAKMNYALEIGAMEDFSPLADAKPYGQLLNTKYQRAARIVSQTKEIQITDLSLAVLDELLSRERIETLSIKEAIQYRKASEGPRRAFMEHMHLLQKRQGQMASTQDYTSEVTRIVETEIRPAVRDYRNTLKGLDDRLVGAITKGGIKWLGGGASVVSLFSDLSLPAILSLSGLAAAHLATSLVERQVEMRAARRECSLSYLLALEN